MGNNFNWEDQPYNLNEAAGDARFEAAIREMKMGVRKVPKLTRDEYEVLQFCHNRDMRQFLKEEFEKHPIILNEDGELVGENPFDRERRLLGEQRRQMTYEDYVGNNCNYDGISW